MVPFKRPAADKSGIPVYQPGTTYQQLMQLQQPFVPVSCEYPTSSSSTSSSSYSTSVNNSTTSATHTATTLIPQPHTTITSSTANPNAINNNNNSTTTNNNHIFVNQSNVNNNNNSSNTVATTTASNGILTETNNNNNNTTTANKEPNSSTISNSVQPLNTIAAQIHSDYISSSNAIEDDLDHNKKSKDANTSGNVSLGNSASSAISFSSAVAPTSSVTYNALQQSHHHQQQQQHPSLAYTYPQASQNHYLHANSLYANPAAIAKEVAQKNYQNALKLAAVSNALSGKPLSALTYSQVPFNKPALLPQPAYAAAPQLTSPRPGLSAPVTANRLPTVSNSQAASQFLRGQTQLNAFARAQNQQATYLNAATTNPYAQFMRPQGTTQATYNPALSMSQTNAYAAQVMQQAQAVAQMQAAANQQYMFYHGLQQAQAAQYPGMTTSMATSGMTNAQQSGMHPNAGLTQTAPPGTTTVVLNPYKKMKTS